MLLIIIFLPAKDNFGEAHSSTYVEHFLTKNYVHLLNLKTTQMAYQIA
jgi:hypothetical protein